MNREHPTPEIAHRLALPLAPANDDAPDYEIIFVDPERFSDDIDAMCARFAEVEY